MTCSIFECVDALQEDCLRKIGVGRFDGWVGYVGGAGALEVSKAWDGGDGVFDSAGEGVGFAVVGVRVTSCM